jgi:DNA modification methylase
MVEFFREVRRVLRKDGVAFVNLGDSYATAPPASPATVADDRTFRGKPFSTIGGGLKPKDLCGVPWRCALALQDDGWYLRSDIIWAKPNPMPESVTDRPTKAHEYIFLLARSERYFWDADAVREKATSATTKMPDGWDTGKGAHGSFHRNGREKGRRTDKQGQTADVAANGRRYAGFNDRWDEAEANGSAPSGRNCRTVWTINPQPWAEAHFATYPEELVRRCLLAGTSERGACPTCGAPWRREKQPTPEYAALFGSNHGADANRHGEGYRKRSPAVTADYVTTGWSPSCRCKPTEPRPCVVLDPFGGSGTTGVVAVRHGRTAILCELNPEYAAMAERRIRPEIGLFSAPVEAQEPQRADAAAQPALAL